MKNTGLDDNIISRIKAMSANGATQSDIADTLGLSTGTVNEVLRS